MEDVEPWPKIKLDIDDIGQAASRSVSRMVSFAMSCYQIKSGNHGQLPGHVHPGTSFAGGGGETGGMGQSIPENCRFFSKFEHANSEILEVPP